MSDRRPGSPGSRLGNGKIPDLAALARARERAATLDRPVPDASLPAGTPSWARGMTARQLFHLGMVWTHLGALCPHLSEYELGSAVGQMIARDDISKKQREL